MPATRALARSTLSLFAVSCLVFAAYPSSSAHSAGSQVAGSQVAGNQVTVKFEAAVGGEAFACGKSYSAIGASKSTITPSDFRYFVTEIQLRNESGQYVPLSLDQDGVWQYKTVALLDFEDGSGPCRNGNSAIRNTVTGTLPEGRYRGIRFTLGVPFELNHGDPTVAPSPLNLTAMFWNWQAGYKFLKLDMATSGLPREATAPTGKGPRAAGFPIHLGSTTCASASPTTTPSSCAQPNRAVIEFDGFDPAANVVVADVAAALQDANVDVNAPETAPGCMGAPNDEDCASVFPAFGLPFKGKPASRQRFFRMR